jgi:hypothetical protein
MYDPSRRKGAIAPVPRFSAGIVCFSDLAGFEWQRLMGEDLEKETTPR